VYSNSPMHGTLSHPHTAAPLPETTIVVARSSSAAGAPRSPLRAADRPAAGQARNGHLAEPIPVAVVGATGYAGGEAVRLLARHPAVRIAAIVGRDARGEPLADRQAHLAGANLTIGSEIPADAAAVFLALPHATAARLVPSIVERGSAVIDLGPDFRLHDAADYPTWYGFEHPRPDLLRRAIYGLPELHRDELEAAGPSALVGAPGCYPTATILATAPLARAGLVADLVVDAKSGVSGAGRDPKPELTFSEVNESVRAYGVGGHRHVAEMEQELRALAPGDLAPVEFVPHLVPMTRGILATCHVRTTRPVDQVELDALYAAAYEGEPFVRLVDAPPATKHVLGSNECRIHVRALPRSGRVVAIAVIDNLVKGAAGQAVQAFNVAFGLSETAGLQSLPVAP
jgi:N-acetyl-gamma-glutamyl-phosphate reductase